MAINSTVNGDQFELQEIETAAKHSPKLFRTTKMIPTNPLLLLLLLLIAPSMLSVISILANYKKVY